MNEDLTLTKKPSKWFTRRWRRWM